MEREFIVIISLVALRGQIMTVKVHSGVCMKYSIGGIYLMLISVTVAPKPKNISFKYITVQPQNLK